MKYKIVFASLLLSVVLVFLAACGGRQSAGIYTSYTPRQIAENIIAQQTNIAPMNYLAPDSEFFLGYITGRYQIDIGEIEIIDGIIFYAGGVIVDEIAVLFLADKADTAAVSDLLRAYADRRRIAFSGYAPIQAGILANAIVSVNGYHVALLVSEDPRGAEETFLASFSDTPPDMHYSNAPQQVAPQGENYYYEDADTVEEIAFNDEIEDVGYSANESILPEATPAPNETETGTDGQYSYDEDSHPEEPAAESTPLQDEPLTAYENDVYNRRAVMQAWSTNDPSELSPMNRRVFDKCAYVIDSVITDGMSGFDKQLAILNWIIMWSVYDPEFLSNAPTARPNPNNDNPYGVLIGQVGNCFGFTYTFQLFMDLLGIESMVVHGYDFTGGRHAWNLVYLYGSWYAVDVTLDVTYNNPLGVDVSHRPETITNRYLNLTSEYLWTVLGHYWDWWSVPIAE